MDDYGDTRVIWGLRGSGCRGLRVLHTILGEF